MNKLCIIKPFVERLEGTACTVLVVRLPRSKLTIVFRRSPSQPLRTNWEMWSAWKFIDERSYQRCYNNQPVLYFLSFNAYSKFADMASNSLCLSCMFSLKQGSLPNHGVFSAVTLLFYSGHWLRARLSHVCSYDLTCLIKRQICTYHQGSSRTKHRLRAGEHKHTHQKTQYHALHQPHT